MFPFSLYHIILLYIEANIHNKRLGRFSIEKAENLYGLDTEQYGSQKSKPSDI